MSLNAQMRHRRRRLLRYGNGVSLRICSFIQAKTAKLSQTESGILNLIGENSREMKLVKKSAENAGA